MSDEKAVTAKRRPTGERPDGATQSGRRFFLINPTDRARLWGSASCARPICAGKIVNDWRKVRQFRKRYTDLLAAAKCFNAMWACSQGGHGFLSRRFDGRLQSGVDVAAGSSGN